MSYVFRTKPDTGFIVKNRVKRGGKKIVQYK